MSQSRNKRRFARGTICAVVLSSIAIALPATQASAVTGDYAEFSIDSPAAGPTEIANLGGDALWASLSAVGKLAKISADGKATILAPNGMASTSSPAGLALGGDKRIWVAENLGNRIGALDPASGAYTAYALPQAQSGPTALAVATDGTIWFTETTGNRIGRIEASGKIIEFDLAQGSAPLDIVRGSDGAMWFTASMANAIGRITPSGVTTSFTLPNANSTPTGIALGSDGNIWFTEKSGNRIGRISPAGAITEFALPNAGSAPLDIAALPDGNLWFTESATNRIGRIGLTGAIIEYSMQQAVRPSGIAAGLDGNVWFTQPVVSKVGRLLTGVLPANQSAPAVSPSTAAVGATLTATTGTWDYAPTNYVFAWQRCTTNSPSVCTTISEASKSSYVLTSTDSSMKVQALVTAANLNGPSPKPVASNQVSVSAAAPAPTPSPAAKPNPVTGQRSVQIGSGINATILSASNARRGRYRTFAMQMSNPSVRGQVRMEVVTSAGTTAFVIAPRKSVNGIGRASKAKRIPYSLPAGYYTLRMVFTPASPQQFMYSSATITIPLRIR